MYKLPRLTSFSNEYLENLAGMKVPLYVSQCVKTLVNCNFAVFEASFTWQRFNQKEHCFIVVFNVRLHGDSENDHINANGLQSEAFQKRTENDLRVNAKKTGKHCS